MFHRPIKDGKRFQKKIEVFLESLEKERHCSIKTRNQRLAAIHTFAQFVGIHSPENLEWCRQLRTIPFKKAQPSLITYLEKEEMETLLRLPNVGSSQGRRDHVLLLFLYNTGARANEAAQLKIADLSLARIPQQAFSSVLLQGKGNKLRRCPLWKQTVNELNTLIEERSSEEAVFLNRRKEPLTRFGIYDLVKRYAKILYLEFPQL